MEIEPLHWDTEFFGRKIGRLTADSIIRPDELDVLGFDTIYIVSSIRQDELESTGIPLIDEKTTLHQKLRGPQSESDLKVFSPEKSSPALLALFLQSGAYSRFNLDPVFNPLFSSFYASWLDNALKGTYDDYIYCTGSADKPSGVLTLKESSNEMAISIIAVDHASRGQGIGRQLIELAKFKARESGKEILSVVTQAKNEPAMKFYLNNGFHVVKREFIYHLHRGHLSKED